MPVSLLLCEGVAESPDARVLNRVLGGLCAIQPLGGKYGMGDRVKARREVLGQRAVFGLLDGDFVRDWNVPALRPRDWVVDERQTHLGWRWERKEIENYLIDPNVVSRALGIKAPNGIAYRAALERARDHICAYEAARLALTIHRPRFRPMSNAFGRSQVGPDHLMPDNLGHNDCTNGIRQSVADHNSRQAVDPANVESEFQTRCRECQAGGSRFSHYLTAFAGKDLLHIMSGDLRAFGFQSPAVFIEKVLQGMDNATDDVWLWLDEWTALRNMIAAI